ncbi:MAG TPA: hypothetical protein VLD35_15200 [Caldimonas sp.]|nr:hypothetical protein [Caldimonas sp.]
MPDSTARSSGATCRRSTITWPAAKRPPATPRAGAALDAALLVYRGACLADSSQPWARAAALSLRERLAAALLRESRGGGAGTTQRRERMLRASAADPLLGTLIAQAG